MSEGARPRKPSPVFAVVVIVLVAALGVEGFLLAHKPARPRDAAGAIKRAGGAKQRTETFGGASAPIQVEFYAPLVLPWHKKTIGLLREWSKQHPDRIFVKLMPMGQPEADKVMTARGFTCAVIFIYGLSDAQRYAREKGVSLEAAVGAIAKHEFALPDGKKVDLQKKPNTADASFYNSEDVITILDHWK